MNLWKVWQQEHVGCDTEKLRGSVLVPEKDADCRIQKAKLAGVRTLVDWSTGAAFQSPCGERARAVLHLDLYTYKIHRYSSLSYKRTQHMFVYDLFTSFHIL